MYIQKDKIIVICSYCKMLKQGSRYIPVSAGWLAHMKTRGFVISHGICDDCLKLELDKLK